MTPIDVVIIVLASLAVVAVMGREIWKRKKGKGGCGCGCNGCPHAKQCQTQAKPKEESPSTGPQKEQNEETV